MKFHNKELIQNWLNENKIKNYIIFDNLTVEVNDNVKLSNRRLKEIPLFFTKVKGNFDISGNGLTSLEGAPQLVEGTFDCTFNYLPSLEGGPKEVKDNYFCGMNRLKYLRGVANIIGGNFFSENNIALTSIDNLPVKVKQAKFVDSPIQIYQPIKSEVQEFIHQVNHPDKRIEIFKDKYQSNILILSQEEFKTSMEQLKLAHDEKVKKMLKHM